MIDIKDNVWIIGDVHGCYKTLIALIEEIKEKSGLEKPIIYFVGDVIDKGPDSKKVLNYIMEHYPNNVVMGNHETFMKKYSYEKSTDLINSNWITRWGGEAMITSYLKEGEEFNKENIQKVLYKKSFNRHFKWVKKLPTFIAVPFEGYKTLVISHSNILNVYDKEFGTDEELYNQFDLNEIIYGREKYKNENDSNIKDIYNVHGHSQIKEPSISHNLANIDTGCVYYNTNKYRFLTAMSYPNFEIINTVCEDIIDYP